MIIEVPFFMGDPMPFAGQVASDERLVPGLPSGSPQERMAALYRALADRVAAADGVPVVVAGDCVSAIGVLAGLQRCDVHPTLYFFDAHGDFHTWETTPSRFIGGMPLAMLTGRGEQTIVEGAGLDPLPDDRVVLVDARDLDPGEPVAESDITVMSVEGVAGGEPAAGPIHVHVDVDVVDPQDMPAVNYPAPGGPGLDAVEAAVRRLAATGRVVAASFSSWNPMLDGASAAAAATARLIAAVRRR